MAFSILCWAWGTATTRASWPCRAPCAPASLTWGLRPSISTGRLTRWTACRRLWTTGLRACGLPCLLLRRQVHLRYASKHVCVFCSSTDDQKSVARLLSSPLSSFLYHICCVLASQGAVYLYSRLGVLIRYWPCRCQQCRSAQGRKQAVEQKMQLSSSCRASLRWQPAVSDLFGRCASSSCARLHFCVYMQTFWPLPFVNT